MGMFRAIALIGIGLLAIGYAGKSMLAGAIDLGGKRSGGYVVTFADDRGVFLFALVFMPVLGAGAVVVGWRAVTRDDEG